MICVSYLVSIFSNVCETSFLSFIHSWTLSTEHSGWRVTEAQ